MSTLSDGPRYYRNAAGDVVHHAGCPRITTSSIAWRYTAEMTDEEVVGVVFSAPWLRWCKACDPTSEARPVGRTARQEKPR